MTVNNFDPAITKFSMSTSDVDETLRASKDSSKTHLYIKATVGGMRDRFIEQLSSEPDDITIVYTLLKQDGGKDPRIIQQFLQTIEKPDCNQYSAKLDFEINEKISNSNFVNQFFYFIISYTDKHLGEMGVGESAYRSIYDNYIFKSKIPFEIEGVELNG